MILTINAALDAIANGETDWATLSHRLPRNDLPELLEELAHTMSRAQLARALMDTWTLCEFPERAADRDLWVDWFETAGYAEDGLPATPPESVVLYRGGSTWDGMSWSATRETAEWFRDRFKGGQLWTLEVPGGWLLARIHADGRGEDEYVVHPEYLWLEEPVPDA